MTLAIRTPVLIVGAGPVGLSLALDLGQRGVNVILIETGSGLIEHSKIGHIAVRTMEFFRRWGIAQAVREAGFPTDFRMSRIICTDVARPPLCIDAHPSLGQMQTPSYACEKKQRCPQHWLQPILLKAVCSEPLIETRFQTELVGFEQKHDHIVASIKQGNDVSHIQAQYMVACDGAESFVRKNLGIGMTGSDKLSYSIGITVKLHGWRDYFKYGEAERFIFLGPEGTWGNLTTVDGGDLWRLTIYGNSEKVELQNFDAGHWVRRALGTLQKDTVQFDIVSVLPWRRREQIATDFHQGRIFLAGDAAHIMSPTGGMGMNTGIGDAVDLGWKLQALVNGWGGARLIESYAKERRPVAVRNASSSTENFKTLTSPKNCLHILDETPEGERVRTQMAADFSKAMRESYWDPSSIQMGYRYDDSGLCIPDGTPTPENITQYIQTARPGARAPHAWLNSDQDPMLSKPMGQQISTLDLFGDGFVLLCFEGADQHSIAQIISAAQMRAVPLNVIPIKSAEIAQLYGAALVLVRPDGHVAWRAQSLNAISAQEIIDRVTGNL